MLVLVLWVLLALTVAASSLAIWVSRATSHAVALADQQRDQLNAIDTLETLKFLLASRPIRTGGLYMGSDAALMVEEWQRDPFGNFRSNFDPDDLALDNQRYSGRGTTHVMLQDETGLVSLQGIDRPQLAGVLEAFGQRPMNLDLLIDHLQEYSRVAAGSFRGRSLAAEYSARGLPAPPGRNLITPLEVVRIASWTGLEFARSPRWRDALTTLYTGPVNVNTAPRWLLPLLPGLDPDAAEKIIEHRRRDPMDGSLQIPESGQRLSPFAYRTLPGQIVRITLADPSDSVGLRYHLRLTPQLDQSSPWRVEMFYPVQVNTLEAADEIADIPEIAHPLFAQTPLSGSGD